MQLEILDLVPIVVKVSFDAKPVTFTNRNSNYIW